MPHSLPLRAPAARPGDMWPPLPPHFQVPCLLGSYSLHLSLRACPPTLYEAALKTALEDLAQACQALDPWDRHQHPAGAVPTSAHHSPLSPHLSPSPDWGLLRDRHCVTGLLASLSLYRVDTEHKRAKVKSGCDGSRGSVLIITEGTVSSGGGRAARGALCL